MLNKLLIGAAVVAAAAFMANDANAFHGFKHRHHHHHHAGRVAVHYPSPVYVVPRHYGPPVRSYYRGLPIHRPKYGVYGPQIYGSRAYGYRPGGVSITIGRGW